MNIVLSIVNMNHLKLIKQEKPADDDFIDVIKEEVPMEEEPNFRSQCTFSRGPNKVFVMIKNKNVFKPFAGWYFQYRPPPSSY